MRGPRTLVGKGVCRDDIGLAAVASVHGHRREQRYPPDTPILTTRKWQEDTRQTLDLLPRRRVGRRRRTLAKDIETYVALVGHLSRVGSVKAELRAWIEQLGDVSRDRITAHNVRRAIVAWRDEDVAPKTINHRLARLRRLSRVLDGPRARSPVDDIALLPLPRVPIHAVDDALIVRVLAALEDRERTGLLQSRAWRARFLVLAMTGRRPSEIMRTQPEDLDFTRRVWMVRDGKGGWSPGLYLTDEMIAAWRLFAQCDAWGEYDPSYLARTLRRAGWPKGLRPYQLRHTVGIRLSEAGIDLADVAAWLGHRRIETARKHYVPVIGSRIQVAAERLSGRNLWHEVHGTGRNNQE